MAAADHDRPVLDLYQLLGVARGASGGEITQAWRRRALAEHPDRRPRDVAAPARFRALADAYRVLGNPVRRAAYDRSLRDQPGPVAAAEDPAAGRPAGRWRPGRGVPVPVTLRPAGRVPEPPLRVGPVWVDVPPPAPVAGSRTPEDDATRLAALSELSELSELSGLSGLSELVVRYLAGDWGGPW